MLYSYLIMQLSKKECKACEGNMPKLTTKQSNTLLKQLKYWKIKNKRIHRQFKFKNFIEAMKFINKVAIIAEKEQHHPDIIIHYNKVNIEIWTHSINGLSENDFILAAKIDKAV